MAALEKTVEDKDLEIVALKNQLEAFNDDNHSDASDIAPGRLDADSDFSPEVSEQKFPKPVKLEEFFPKGFLNEDEIIVGVHAVSITEDHERNDSDEQNTKPTNVPVENLPKATVDEKLKNLKGISSRLTIVELLQYPKVVRESIVEALRSPTIYAGDLKLTIETSLKTLSLGKKQTPNPALCPKKYVERKVNRHSRSLLNLKMLNFCLEKLKQNIQVLKETCALPLVSLANNQVSKPLEGFVRPSEGAIEHGTFHQEGTVQSYGPNAYKLIAKAGFDLSKPTAVDELHTKKTTKKLQGITDAHKKLINEAKGRSFSKAGLGCEPPKPIRIHGIKKDHSASIQHISVEIIDEVGSPSTKQKSNSKAQISF
ncbi:hypothetical protein COLO4_33873 [Corchorus olitorius]|uniref:Uncharacterized protein n=1 Tax=Corchorus olitorius TaxID=93759 RepID=A0A1R3GQF6_9ROSI|nr:hypothetical protein COLO4_33873 [Corchorus olitorius]